MRSLVRQKSSLGSHYSLPPGTLATGSTDTSKAVAVGASPVASQSTLQADSPHLRYGGPKGSKNRALQGASAGASQGPDSGPVRRRRACETR